MANDESLTSSSLTSYRPNKSNRLCLTPTDRISALPIELRYEIMHAMPLQHAAQMSGLSKTWLDTWRSLPILCFGKGFHDHMTYFRQLSGVKCVSILFKVLLCHTGSLTGILLVHPLMKLDDNGPVLSLLSMKDIKHICLINVDIADAVYPKLSSQFFSCMKLKRLLLKGRWQLHIPPSFKGFKKLVSLYVYSSIVTGKSVSDFIASCPLLENLKLKQCDGLGPINIVAPNLKYFEFSGKFEGLSFSNAPNLKDLGITSVMINHHNFRPLELLTCLKCSNIERLLVEGSLFKLMAAVFTWRMVPRYFDSLKVLGLKSIELNDLSELRGVLGMIESCSNCELIIISFSSKSSIEHNNLTPFDADYNFPVLRKVRVTSVLGFYMELILIEVLLLCSPALEELCVIRSAEIQPNLESKLIRDLMFFQRTSPKARVIYLDPEPASS